MAKVRMDLDSFGWQAPRRRGRRPAPGRSAGPRPSADGGRGGQPDPGGPLRTDRRPLRFPQRVSDPHLGYAGGDLGAADPKVAPGSYFPSLLEPRRRSERAVVSVVQEAYVHGVSTRKVDDLVRALGLEGISKSQVWRICKELDREVEAFRNRPIQASTPTCSWTPLTTK
jgi:hypothetical protein